MAEEKRSWTKRGLATLVLRLGSGVIAVYVLQWILQLVFSAPDSDAVATGLRPFQNHYLSFSKYYLTTEGAAGEFTSDTTAAGRYFAMLIPGVIILLLLMIPVYIIKPLRPRYNTIFWTSLVMGLIVLFYSEFFVPRIKTTFSEGTMTVENTHWIFSKRTAKIKYTDIERFEYNFLKVNEGYTMQKLLYLRLYVVIGGKSYLIGENQIEPGDDTLTATEAQKSEAQHAVDVLRTLVGINRGGSVRKGHEEHEETRRAQRQFSS